jgi:GTP pyrophosphokinase
MLLLESAIDLAVHAHRDQMDEDGMPHIIHCFEVMLKVKEACERTDFEPAVAALYAYTLEDLLTAAVLHDTVEDSPIPLKHIEIVFGKKVATLVDGVTRRGLGEGWRSRPSSSATTGRRSRRSRRRRPVRW